MSHTDTITLGRNAALTYTVLNGIALRRARQQARLDRNARVRRVLTALVTFKWKRRGA